MSKMIRDDSVVRCLEHGEVHANTTDPYDYGEPNCSKKSHRTVYWRAGVRDEEHDE